jgi:hypothetical protein
VVVRKVFLSDKQRRRAAKRSKAELQAKRSHSTRVKRRAVDSPPSHAPKRNSAKYRHITNLEAPGQFSLVDNPEPVIAYFSDARRLLNSGKHVSFDLSGVAGVTPDAIALLSASVNSKWFKGKGRIIGNEPRDPTAALMFQQSGFYDHVASRRPSTNQNKKHLLLHRVTQNKVENIEAMNAGKFAVSHLFQDGRRIRPLYEVFIECMANTNNHAEPGQRGFYDWWLFVYNDPNRKRTVFTFLDLGVGVFNSLPVRTFLRNALLAIGVTSNIDLLPKLFAGEISSRTLMKARGKGIPRIHEHAIGGTFSKFVMIANDVYADMVNRRYNLLPNPFHGTFFCFAIELAEAETK